MQPLIRRFTYCMRKVAWTGLRIYRKARLVVETSLDKMQLVLLKFETFFSIRRLHSIAKVLPNHMNKNQHFLRFKAHSLRDL